MKPTSILDILADVERGTLSAEAAADRLKSLPFEDLGHTRVDHHRSLRTGLPEVIYAAGKTAEQTASIFASLAASGVDVLATRVDASTAALLLSQHPGALHSTVARTVTLRQAAESPTPLGHIAVVCAGTSDLFVAEEAAITAEIFNISVTRLYFGVRRAS